MPTDIHILHQMAETFPMMRGAGLFVLLVGLGIAAGGILGQRYVLPTLIAGGVLASLSQIIRIRNVTAFPGNPTAIQFYILVGGIAFEIVLVGAVVYLIRDRRSREFWLWILFVVGVHFCVLSFAQGPPLLLLGVLSMINAAIGLRASGSYLRFWTIDGLLKIVVGASMLILG